MATSDNRRSKRSYGKKNDRRENSSHTTSLAKQSVHDWRDYAVNEQLLRDTCSIPFTWPLGNRLDLGSYGADYNNHSLPGVMAIYLAATYGYTEQQNAPINVAARNVQAFVRHANSGHTNYDSPDLMLYLTAMDQAYSYLAWLKRLYGIIMTYSPVNRFYATALIQANHVDYTELIGNLADFRAFINAFAVKVGSMVIPANMSFMKSHSDMYSNLYFDSQVAKAQTYVFVPHLFYKFELDPRGVGCLVEMERFDLDRKFTLAELKKMAYDIIDPILASEDMGIIGGDILKAYGPEKVVQIAMIDEMYTVLPQYDPIMLDRIHNATLLGDIVFPDYEGDSTDFDTTGIVLYQNKSQVAPYLDNGILESKPVFHHPYRYTGDDPGANAWLIKRFVDFEHDNINAAEVMDATRLTNIGSSYSHDTEWHTVKTIASEVATSAVVYYYAVNKTTGEWELTSTPRMYVGTTHVLEASILVDTVDPTKFMLNSLDGLGLLSTIRDDQFNLQMISQFNRHPQIAVTTAIADPIRNLIRFLPINNSLMEIDNYAIVDANNLILMAETALIAQFDVTQFGRAAQ